MYLLCMVVTHQGAATWLESQFPQLSAVLHYSAALHCYFTVKAMYLVWQHPQQCQSTDQVGNLEFAVNFNWQSEQRRHNKQFFFPNQK